MTKNLTEGNPAKLIVLFTIPLLIGNIFQQFYNMTDMVIVGRTLGVNALAAVGCTGSIIFLVLGFTVGLTSGLSIVTAQRFGSHDEAGVRKSLTIGILITLAVTLVLTTVSVLMARPILELMRTPPEIIEDAHDFVVIIFAGMAASMMFNLLSNTIRALGDSKTPLFFLMFTCALNIILDFTFILVFRSGVAGAALATIISQFIAGSLCIVYIKKRLPILHLSRADWNISGWEVLQCAKMAFPMAFQMSIIAIGAVVLQFALNQLGEISVAAFSTAQKIDAIAMLPMNSFGVTMATYTAQNYGAGKIDRIKKGVLQCSIISVSFSIVVGLVNILAGYQLASLFVGSNAPEVSGLVQTYLIINGSQYFLLAMLFIFRFTLQGLGKGVMPTVAGIMELLMRMFAALILSSYFGFAGACWSGPLAWLGACIPLAIAFFTVMRQFST